MNLQKRIEILLFCTIFFAYAYFLQGRGGWGTTVRFDFVYAVAEKGTLQIDDYHENTGDKAYFKEHFYLDKAPGGVFLGIPVYFIIKSAANILHLPIPQDPNNTFVTSLITLLAVSLPSALFIIYFFRFINSFAKKTIYALWLALAYGLATLAFPYSTLFHGHHIAAICSFISFGMIFDMKRKKAFENFPLLLAGILAGYSIISEYQTGLILIGLSVYLTTILDQKKKLLYYGLGIFLSLIPLFIFNKLCFQNIFHLGYNYCWFPEYYAKTKQGIFGINISSFNVAHLYGITFSPYRGLFYFSPFLALAFVGLCFLFRQRQLRKEGILLTFLSLAYILWFSSYFGWYSGWCFGPRYLIPILPFLTFPIIFFLNGFSHRPFMLLLFKALALISFIYILMGTAVNPEFIPHLIARPLQDWCLPAILNGRISFNLGFFLINCFSRWLSNPALSLLTLLPLLLYLGIMVYILTKLASKIDAAK
ncbi:MAG: hypothetical protein HQL24_01890 [Candidatus Omnitrophica bacterium]|nr:hypothetical protein [Candidatus Omnitrophota bacterium]